MEGGGAAVVHPEGQPPGHLGRGGGRAAHLFPGRSAELLLDLQDQWAQVKLGPDGRVVVVHVHRHVARTLQRRQAEQGRPGLRFRLLARTRRGWLLYLDGK